MGLGLEVGLGSGVGLGNCNCFDQDRAAMSEGEGVDETQRGQEKLVSEEETWPSEEGEQRVLEGLQKGTAGSGGAAQVAEAGVH